MMMDNSHLLDGVSKKVDKHDHVVINVESNALEEIMEFSVTGDIFQKSRKLLQMFSCTFLSREKRTEIRETNLNKLKIVDETDDDECCNKDKKSDNNADDAEEIIEFNVSGCPFKTCAGTLDSFPGSIFGSKEKRATLLRLGTGEIFFNRNTDVFRSILTFCQTGILDAPTRVDLDIFIRDIRYYGLDEQALVCGFKEFEEKTVKYAKPQCQLFKSIWTVLEFPYSSIKARVISIISLLTIITSIIVFCWETIPGYNKHSEHFSPDKTHTVDVLHQVEMFCVCYFTVELSTRFIVSPNKYQFLTDFLNIIDLVSIISYFLSHLSITHETGYIYAFRVVRLFRVSRVFKLSRHSNEMKILGVAVRESAKDMLVLISFVLIGVLLFSSAIYYAEEGSAESKLKSIPGAFWWSIVTMTTVGYGDMVPVSIAGRIVGAACAVSGILLISMIIPIIANNFTRQYKILKPKPTYFEEIKRRNERNEPQQKGCMSKFHTWSTARIT